MKDSALYEAPFSQLHAGGPDELFAGKEAVVDSLFTTLGEVHSGLSSVASQLIKTPRHYRVAPRIAPTGLPQTRTCAINASGSSVKSFTT